MTGYLMRTITTREREKADDYSSESVLSPFTQP